MRKFKFYIDYDKEEKWLEAMSQKGYQLENKSFGYKFHFTKPEDAVIKIDYRTFKKQEDFIDYCTLFEDSGWQHIAGNKNSGTQYFRKTNADSSDDIFSDEISKTGKYKRLSDMFIGLAITYLPLFAALISTGVINMDILLNPQSLYLTQGLWEMTGESFWGAFLFETPFALFRGALSLFIPVMMILYGVFAFKAQRLYDKSKN